MSYMNIKALLWYSHQRYKSTDTKHLIKNQSISYSLILILQLIDHVPLSDSYYYFGASSHHTHN